MDTGKPLEISNYGILLRVVFEIMWKRANKAKTRKKALYEVRGAWIRTVGNAEEEMYNLYIEKLRLER